MLSKVTLDFNGAQQASSDEVVISKGKLTVGVNELHAVDIDREKIFAAYQKAFYKKDLMSQMSSQDLNALGPTLSRAVFVPLGEWIQTLEFAISQNIIESKTQIIIPRATKKPVICVLEAEGESQGSLLYKKHFYLPVLVEQFLKSKGFTNIKVLRRDVYLSLFKKHIRGFIFIHIKFLQQILYKLRSGLTKKSSVKINKIIFATRGIVQTHFLDSFIDMFDKKDVSIFVNESSIFPFRNHKAIASVNREFHYLEGRIPLQRICKDYLFAVKGFLFKSFISKKLFVEFFGLQINLTMVLSELDIFKYYSETQGLSIKYYLKKNKIEGTQSIFCFDMLTPQPFYVKQMNPNHFVGQIQTTLMAGVKQENFVFGDAFYFTDLGTYKAHCAVNKDFASKFKLLHDLKYVNIKKSGRIKNVKNVTFFTQPVFLMEELALITELKNYFYNRNIVMHLKLHPRSLLSDYRDLELPLISKEMDSISAIAASDLVITRNSTIGLDSWKLCVPVMFMVYKSLTGDNINYIPQNYMGTFTSKPSPVQLDDFIENLEKYYYNYTNKIFHEVSKESLIDVFLNKS